MAGFTLSKRYCYEYTNGVIECSGDDGFWYTTKGIIIKWSVLGGITLIFLLWFIGGYIHAKRRMRAGQPLMGYHRFLVSQPERKRYGRNGVPQNHFTFYQPNAPYRQRQDGAWSEPPPMYNNNDAPPQYFPPPGASKVNANQNGGPGMEMPQYGGQQTSGVIGGSAGNADVEAQNPQLPPRPQPAKGKINGILDRFRK